METTVLDNLSVAEKCLSFKSSVSKNVQIDETHSIQGARVQENLQTAAVTNELVIIELMKFLSPKDLKCCRHVVKLWTAFATQELLRRDVHCVQFEYSLTDSWIQSNHPKRTTNLQFESALELFKNCLQKTSLFPCTHFKFRGRTNEPFSSRSLEKHLSSFFSPLQTVVKTLSLTSLDWCTVLKLLAQLSNIQILIIGSNFWNVDESENQSGQDSLDDLVSLKCIKIEGRVGPGNEAIEKILVAATNLEKLDWYYWEDIDLVIRLKKPHTIRTWPGDLSCAHKNRLEQMAIRIRPQFKHLVLYTIHPLGGYQMTASIALKFLQSSKNSLEKLALTQLNYEAHHHDEYPSLKNLRTLEIVRLDQILGSEVGGTFVPNGLCLQKTFPRVKILVLLSSTLLYARWHRDFPAKANSNFGSVTSLQLNGNNCAPHALRVLRDFCPNVNKLRLTTPGSHLPAVLHELFNSWQHLWSLKIYDSVIMNLDSILTGLSDKVCQELRTQDVEHFDWDQVERKFSWIGNIKGLKILKMVYDAKGQRPGPITRATRIGAFQLMPDLAVTLLTPDETTILSNKNI